MNNYFSHDSNARNSKKILRLRMRHGASGYGIYFMLLERLREEQGYMCDADYEMLSFDLREDAELIRSVVEDFGLFALTEDGKKFYSAGFEERMNMKMSKSHAGAMGAQSRWGKKDEIPSEMAQNGTIDSKADSTDGTTNSANGSAFFDKSKVKEKKEKDNISLSLTPSLTVGETDTDILSIFFFEKRYRGAQKEAERFINFYKSNGMYGKLTPEQLAAKARLWEPKGEQDYIYKRFSDGFIRFWRSVYDELLRNKAPATLLNQARSDKIAECAVEPSRPDTYWLKIPDAVRDWIEGEHGFDIGIVRRYVRDELGLKNLNYKPI